MPNISSDFIKAWYKWIRRPVPASNSDIDHSASYVHGLVGSFIGGKQLDFKSLAAEELANIEQIRVDLNDSELNNENREEYLSYLSDITFLLEEMSRH